MSKKSQIGRALRVGLAALCATALYEITKQICFPRLSLVESEIITTLFAGCVGFCISFVIRQREQAAEQELLRLASIVECSQDAIIGKTLEGVITSWNRAAEKMYGYTMTEAVGQKISFLLPPARQAEIRELMERIGDGQSIDCLETQRLTKTGSLLDVSVSISPIKDADGRITGTSTIARDIPLRK